MKKGKYFAACVVCGKPADEASQFCCDGRDCGCMGLPIDPPLCSDECSDIFYNEPPGSDDTGGRG